MLASFSSLNFYKKYDIMKIIKTEVLVCGAGCAGITAAIASAKNGAKTLLIERAGFVGGIITAVGLPYLDGAVELKTGKVVVKGIPLELMQALGVVNTPDPKTINDFAEKTVDKKWMTIRLPNTERYKLITDQFINRYKSNLSVLFHTLVADTEVKKGRVSAVIVANKDGLVRIEAKHVIDCTGDADVARFGGLPVEKTTPLMPLTLHFRIGNVVPTKDMQDIAKTVLAKIYKEGKIPMFYGPGIMFAFGDNEAYIHTIRVPGDASDAADLSRVEMQARKDSWAIFEAWKKEVPGFENSYYMSSSPYTGVRETFRIKGEYILTADDMWKKKRFDDAIATGCWHFDRHPNKQTFHPVEDIDAGKQPLMERITPDAYDIPFRSLIAKSVSNLLVAGRCHSATNEAATSTRVTVTAMALGEAAGSAASMAVKDKKEMALLNGVKVREMLTQNNGGPFTDLK
jgi:ribulose 1,5-bisphosphate synthetase/thiazole synthase